jgi:putative nucleotidyltransferase with HDIG domain
MSVHAIKEAERTRESYAQRGRPMDSTPRRGELVVGGAFVAAAAALALVAGIGRFSPVTAVLYVVAVAVAGNVRFDVGAGFTVPTQALFVPMLFALPPSLVPILIPLALALGMTPRIVRGEIAPSWLLTAIGNSWFAIGPAVVLVAANDRSPVGHWQILLLALLAQFVCDFAASAAKERLYGGLQIGELVGECQPIYAIDLALSMLGLTVAYSTIVAHSQWAVLLIAPAFAMLRFFSRERHERLEQLAELNHAYQGTALLLGDVVEADDAYTGEHCKSVVRLALEVADLLGLDADQKRNVEFGALLHDVGKIAVPKEIINKPGKLDEQEWAIIKTHTIEGQRMLEKIGGFMSEIGRIVRSSHERWDGSGYPDGLSGESIPLEARIVSACDAFNAMTTTRSYRKAIPLIDARAELKRCAGSHFDPRVARALLEAIELTVAPVETLADDGPSDQAREAPMPVPVPVQPGDLLTGLPWPLPRTAADSPAQRRGARPVVR